MRRWLIFIAISLSSLGCRKHPGNYTAIAFYNCENFFDTLHDSDKSDEEFTPDGKYHYTDRIYHQKLHNIATVIQHMSGPNVPDGPTLIGLAEIENDHVLNDLINQPEIADRHYKFIWFNGPDPRGITVALLYQPEYFVMLSARPLPVILDSTERLREILYVKGIIRDDTVNILINHWPSRLGGQTLTEARRLVAAKKNRDAIATIYGHNKEAHVIVMGDFNDNPTDSSIASVLGAGQIQDTIANGLYNPYTAIYQQGLGTLEYKHHWDLFDQIICSGSFFKKTTSLHFDKAEIFKPEFIIDHHGKMEGYPHRSFLGTHWINGYSDHFPVMLYLSRN